MVHVTSLDEDFFFPRSSLFSLSLSLSPPRSILLSNCPFPLRAVSVHSASPLQGKAQATRARGLERACPSRSRKKSKERERAKRASEARRRKKNDRFLFPQLTAAEPSGRRCAVGAEPARASLPRSLTRSKPEESSPTVSAVVDAEAAAAAAAAPASTGLLLLPRTDARHGNAAASSRTWLPAAEAEGAEVSAPSPPVPVRAAVRAERPPGLDIFFGFVFAKKKQSEGVVVCERERQ